MARAFQPELVKSTVWLGPVKTPADQLGSSQLPLVGIIQELVCAKTAVEVNTIIETTTHNARPLPAARQFEVRIMIPAPW